MQPINGKLRSGSNHNFFAAIIVGQVDGLTAEGQMDRQIQKQTDGQTED